MRSRKEKWNFSWYIVTPNPASKLQLYNQIWNSLLVYCICKNVIMEYILKMCIYICNSAERNYENYLQICIHSTMKLMSKIPASNPSCLLSSWNYEKNTELWN
jgi:hypothetical protein